jgi:hypothetical protein
MKLVKVGIVGAVAASALLLSTSPASADSGAIYSGGGSDCVGMWLSGSNVFQIADLAGGKDDDYCYIDYGPSRKLADRRLSIPIDSSIGNWQVVASPDLSGIGDQIFFKVCEERENDPDLCSNTVGYAK